MATHGHDVNQSLTKACLKGNSSQLPFHTLAIFTYNI